MRWRLFIALGTLATAGVAFGIVHWWSAIRGVLARDATAARSSPRPGYVGDSACARCHSDIARSFRNSEMARSWGPVAQSERIEPPGEIYDSKSNMHYQMFWRDGQLIVREFRLDAHGDETDSREVEAKHHIGSGRHGRAYTTEDRGYVTKMPVGWYADFSEWRMGPGYERTNLRFDRPIIPECLGCHGSHPDFIAGSGNRYRLPLPQPLGCERCHGPGADHVAARRRAPAVRDTEHEADPTIVNPARLSHELAQDLCLHCHLQAEIMVDQPGTGLSEFRPGKRLRDFRSYFFGGEQEPTKPASVGHVPRSQLSRCFTESTGRMTCMSCHEPHRPMDEVPVSFYNASCLKCHSERGCSRALEPGESAAGGNCVTCHMPRVASGDIGHAVTTEHWIRRRPESGPLVDPRSADEPTRALPKGFWGDEPGGQLGAAVLLSPSHRTNPELLEQALSMLEQAVQQQPDALEWRLHLGRGYYESRRYADAVPVLEQVVATDPRQSEAWEMLGMSHGSLGQMARAIEAYENALRHNPDNAAVDYKLAVMYSSQNQPERLIEMARQSFGGHPDDPRVLGLLAHTQFRHRHDPAAALATLERAQRIDPTLVQLYLLEAQIALTQGDAKRLERARRGAAAAQASPRPDR